MRKRIPSAESARNAKRLERTERIQHIKHAFSRDHLKALFTQRSFTAGGYTALSCVIVIALAAAMVMGVGALPSTWTQIDISEGQTTSITDATQDYLDALGDDVTIYLVAEEGNENAYLTLLLDKYADASDRVSVQQKDPVLYPAFTSQYTSEELTDNSLIITCGDDFRIVDYYDLYTMNSSSYSYDFAGEQAITGAIMAMTSDDLPVVYTLEGHGSTDLPTTVTDDLDTANVELRELNLLAEGSVPQDADAVIFYAPDTDLSAEEADALLDYLESGGSLLLMTDYDDTDMPNLANVMNAYGVEAEEGLVVEGGAGSYLSGYPYYLLPEVESHEATSSAYEANSYILMPLAHGISEIDQYRSSLDVTQLLETTASAYIKEDPENAETLEREDGDDAGTTMVGVAITEEVESDDGNDDETRIVWYSSTSCLNTQVDARVGGANTTMVCDAVSWLADADETTTAIASKSTGTGMLVVDESSAAMVSLFVVILVPAFFLVVGFVIWRSRRKL